ncbi:amino-acid N-acetyltransferase [Mycetocola reblochoni]|uniref:N-acetylglutamate synthase n=2 Tax=Mycetocola reblochoni TaxID=331618 RepID=A0A1R4I6V8_9MICO|nr:amino-acid N-acetyltransferase [Mycetocola reblochoni]RLP68903.1 amino-acid N-acetyltransferase [Mycetocola reblochoni]SJN15560.1 N-acetylglutamate synthase [Mycetocola reblochoni REB411]
MTGFTIRPARTTDVIEIERLIQPLVDRRILLGKDRVVFYEAVQEFRVAVDADGRLVGCGALHVIWEDLGEVRTLAVAEDQLGRGIGSALVERLEVDAVALGLRRLFCLTFETAFFGRHGFAPMGEDPLEPHVYHEIVRSSDEGVAEFLDLARVKPNTLGNTRMLKWLDGRDR